MTKRSQQNIKAAFAGESQARNKYTYYAEQARKEGNEEIAQLFERMADNEKEHAKIWFKLLNSGLGSIEANLKEAASGENYEWKTMYPEFAKQAREDGLETLAVMFEKVAAIENYHEKQFYDALLKFYDEKNGKEVQQHVSFDLFSYRCKYCGNLEESLLDVCPVCECQNCFEKVIA